MDKTYDPRAIEPSAYKAWEEAGFEPQGQGLPYCIMLPPPNVTGSLHMGHGFQQTLMDILTRVHRMQGDRTLWQPGTDHAGIATQMVVQRQLDAEGVSKHDLGRDAFIERIWEWKNASGGRIGEQMRRLGASADWSRERFTMDEGCSEAVQRAFVELYREGTIYRGKRLVNWDPVFQTAVSDLEVIQKEKQGHLWHIRYVLDEDESQSLTVATTRPETLLGDVAVAVHPEDERYQSWIGKSLRLPLVDRLIPVIADEMVEREFGSGCVKITPAHDFNDYEVGLRHELRMINILTPDAKMNVYAPERFRGLDRFEARKLIVAELEEAGLLVKTETHTSMIPTAERGGATLEPFLTDQWFVKTEALAEPAIEAVTSGKIRFIPDNAKNIYFEWMHNIQDWCISRQLWWGHRIPAWFDAEGDVFVGHSEVEVRAHYQLSPKKKLKRETDVLDTWFSSALWPFSTLGWPEQTPELQAFYPGAVLVTGFDIIFFWVARMIMFGLKFMGGVPFRDVYIHGLIRDHDGQKMSKSKGNVIDPVDLIDGIDLESLLAKRTSGMMQPHLAEKITKATRKTYPEGIDAYGTDALRFTYCALASTSRDICFDISRLGGYRNFCNKLWNATRLVMMQCEQYSSIQWQSASPAHALDRWIFSRVNDAVDQVHRALSEYRFDHMAKVIYETVWNDYCDWYLEGAKAILSDESLPESVRAGTMHTMVSVLNMLLRLAHPVIPFITEAIWTHMRMLDPSLPEVLMLAEYPHSMPELNDPQAEADMSWLQSIVTGVRTIRSEMNVSPAIEVRLLLEKADEQQASAVERLGGLVRALAKASEITVLGEGEQPPASAAFVMGEMTVHLPIKGMIDEEKERERLQKAIDRCVAEITRLDKKLSNPSFVSNAPDVVVEEQRKKLEAARHEKATLLRQQEMLV